MSTINQAIINRVESFIQDLNELLREAAVQSIHEALELHELGARGGRGRRRGRAASALASSATGRGKRTKEELDKLSARVRGYIEAHPGEGVEQIAKGLNSSSKELILPIRRLLASGQVSTSGHKRATKYFAGQARSARGRRRRRG